MTLSEQTLIHGLKRALRAATIDHVAGYVAYHDKC
jgi:hypothetical protein